MVSKSKHTLLTLGKHTRLTPSHVVVVLLAPSQRRIADLLGSGPVDGPPLDEETDLLEPLPDDLEARKSSSFILRPRGVCVPDAILSSLDLRDNLLPFRLVAPVELSVDR